MTNQTALILEDEPIVGFALEDMLLDLGYEHVELTTSIAEARRFLESARPNIAVLDVNIHGERSYGLTEVLLAKGIPFVFASGYGDAEHPEALKKVPTMTKPYNSADLRRALEQARAGAEELTDTAPSDD